MPDTKNYKHQWYLRNKNRLIEKAQNRYDEKRKLVSQLKDKPCSDCGKKYVAEAMEFDHITVDSKKFRLAICNRSKVNIIEEAAKCEVVCANCHRLRTQARRAITKKFSKSKKEYIPAKNVSRSQDLAAYQREKNKKSYYKNRDSRSANIAKYRNAKLALIQKLKDKPCADCGIQYPPEIMEFDHIEPSTKKFSLANARTSIENIVAEAEKCEIVCANCHRMRTSERRKIK